MNKQRRKLIEKAVAQLQDGLSLLQQAAEEEREYVDNAPDNLRDSERYQTAGEGADILENAASEIEDQINEIEGVQ